MEMSQSADEGGKSSNSACTFKEGTILVDMDLFTCILDIIKKTEKYCFIITPFLETHEKWANLWKLFDDVYNDGKKLFLILKRPIDESQNDWEKEDRKRIEIIKNYCNGKFDLFLVNNLHSKIYLNEKQVLMTSFNLRKYTLEMNHEIGCLIDDPNISKQIINNIIIKKMLNDKDTKHLDGKWAEWINNKINNVKNINNSQSSKSSHDESNNDNPSGESSSDNSNSEDIKQGHCICCNKIIPFDKKNPVCESCLSEKSSCNGKYCHKCGKDDPGRSKYAPLCNYCYKNQEEIL